MFDLFTALAFSPLFPLFFFYKQSRLPPAATPPLVPDDLHLHTHSLGLARRERDPPRRGESPHLLPGRRVENGVDDGALTSACSSVSFSSSPSPGNELHSPPLLELVERVEEVLPAGPGELGGEERDGAARVEGRGG